MDSTEKAIRRSKTQSYLVRTQHQKNENQFSIITRLKLLGFDACYDIQSAKCLS